MGQITIRLTDDLDKKIREMAAMDRRSINAEVLWLLEQAVGLRRKS